MQQYMNRTLELLLMEQTYTVPTVEFSRTPKRRSKERFHTGRSSGALVRDESDGLFITDDDRRQSISKRKDVDFAPRKKGLGRGITKNFRSSETTGGLTGGFRNSVNSQLPSASPDLVQEYGKQHPDSDRVQE